MNTSTRLSCSGTVEHFFTQLFSFSFSLMYFAFGVPLFLSFSIWKDAQLKRSVVFPLGHDNYQSSQWETLYNGERKGLNFGREKEKRKSWNDPKKGGRRGSTVLPSRVFKKVNELTLPSNDTHTSCNLLWGFDCGGPAKKSIRRLPKKGAQNQI